MKKLTALLLTVALLCACFSVAAADKKQINYTEDDHKKSTGARPASVENNPVIEGEDPVTGLPLANDEPYTPILVVLDGSEQAFPHWGVGSATAIFQVPNMSMGNNKLLALFSSEYPHLAGGSRSSRMVSLPVTNCFGAAFVAAGTPVATRDQTDVRHWLKEWNLNADGKWYNLLSGGSLVERTDLVPSPANLLVHVDEIHQELISKGVAFEKRPFLFADEPLTRGDDATVIEMRFYENLNKTYNRASHCTFYYDPALGVYQRVSIMGKGSNEVEDFNYDRISGDTLCFANVIVLRLQFKYISEPEGGGFYHIVDNFAGGGVAEIFQSGKYIRGSWYRDGVFGRLILLDDEGNELKLQRGVSYFVLNDYRAVISYE